MISINFNYSDSLVKIELDSDNAENIIFYVLSDGKKIHVKYLNKKYILLSKSIFLKKKVRFQFYYKDKSVLKSSITKHIAYNQVDRSMFSLILGGKNYKGLKKNGYFSVDKSIFSYLDDNINWMTPHHNFNFNLNSLRFLNSFWGEFFRSYSVNVLEEIYGFIAQYYHFMRSGSKGKFINYDMALGIRALHISLLYQFKDFLTNEQQKVLEWMYKTHVNLMLNPGIFKLTNHGVWLIYGLRILVFVKGDGDKTTLQYCQDRFTELLNFSFNKESICVENSPFYHQYNLDLYNKIPTTLFSNCFNFKGILTEGREAIQWMTDSNGVYYQIGDTEGKGRFFLDFKKIKPDGRDLTNYFFSKAFELSGYFFVKTTNSEFQINSELAFYNTANTIIHKHVDGNAFIFFYKNIEVFSDAGKYAYEYTDLRKYFISSYAHNTVLLENEDITLSDLNLDNSRFIEKGFEGDVYSIISYVEYINKLNHKRIFTYKALKHINIVDEIENHTDSNIILNFVFGKGIELIEFDDCLFIQHTGKLIGKMILDKSIKSYNIHCGSLNPYKGWISKSYKQSKPITTLELIFFKSVNQVETNIHFFE